MNYGKEVNETFQSGFDALQAFLFLVQRAVGFIVTNPVILFIVLFLWLVGGRAGLKLGKIFDVKMG